MYHKNGSCITTDLYCKPKDTHQYQDFLSYHTSHTKHNNQFNLARRIGTIITDKTLHSWRLKELKLFLQRQKYPINLINAGRKRALQIALHVLRNSNQFPNNSNNEGKFTAGENLLCYAYNKKWNQKPFICFKQSIICSALKDRLNLQLSYLLNSQFFVDCWWWGTFLNANHGLFTCETLSYINIETI